MTRKSRVSRAIARILSLSAVLFGFWSCDLEARTVVKSGDVVDLVEGRIDEVLLEASILFPRPSDDVKADMVEFLSRHFRKFGNVKQVERGLNSFLSADVVFPLKRAGSRIEPSGEDLLTFYASVEASAQALSLQIGENRFNEISKFVYEKTMQNISLKDLAVILDFSNDSYVELEFDAGYCFVEGVPVLEKSKFALEAGGTEEIRLADVLRDHIAEKGATEIFRFRW